MAPAKSASLCKAANGEAPGLRIYGALETQGHFESTP
jgi:hypothetical protein